MAYNMQYHEAYNMLMKNVDEAVETEAGKILESPSIIEGLKPHLNNLVVGEDENKIIIATLSLSSKYRQPKYKQIILIKGTEGGGKSTLMRELTHGYKVKEVGRFTEHALDYSDLEAYDILRIKEIGGMDLEKQGVSTIKFLSADDEGYTVEYPVRGEDGRFKTETKRIPAITTISSTTRLIIDSQFERRAWLLNVDESREQSLRVMRWKALLEREQAEVDLGIRVLTSYEYSKKVYTKVVEKIEPVKIIIPFPQTIAEVLSPDSLRIRGDISKVYIFIKLYSLWNLKRIIRVNESTYITTPEVALEAISIIDSTLRHMVSHLDERVKQVLEGLKTVEEIHGAGAGEEYVRYDYAGAVITKSVRDKLVVKTGKSDRTIRRVFDYLVNSGYMSSDQKRPKTYTLLYSVDEILNKLSGVFVLDKNSVLDKNALSKDFGLKMVKEAKIWLKHLLDKQFLRMDENTLWTRLDNNKADSDLSNSVQNTNLPIRGKSLSNSTLDENIGSFNEKRLKSLDTGILSNRRILSNRMSENEESDSHE